MKDWRDLGGGVRVAFFDGPGGAKNGGLFVEHPRPDGGGPCEGTIRFVAGWNPNEPLWTLLSEDPLTVTPSLDCQACGWHHCISGGRIVG